MASWMKTNRDSVGAHPVRDGHTVRWRFDVASRAQGALPQRGFRPSRFREIQPTRINNFNIRLNCAPYGGFSMPVPLKRACRKIGFICEKVWNPASP